MTQTQTLNAAVLDTPVPEPRHRPKATMILALLLVLACVGLGVAGTGLLQARVKADDQRATEKARASALGAATRYAVDFSTYDHKTLDATFKKVAGELTGDFKTQYLATSASLKATLKKYRGKAVATVQAAGVISATDSKAVVVVLLDQSVTSSASTTPRIDRSRMVITLERDNGEWLMSNLDLK